MTDKQIIIDGVDVSGCDFLNKTRHCKAHISIMGIDTNKCKCSSNCYYKQLKREEQECQQAMDNYVQLDLQRVKEYNELVDLYKAKEQECENLKEDIERWKSNFNGKVSAIEELLQQLDQLKAENDTLRQFLSKEPLALQALQSSYASYKKSSDVFYEMVKQYKQTLTEIKYIAEKHKATAHCDYLTDMDNILQKISEYEVENDN